MTITFEQIQKANETLKAMDVKGKSYIEVNQRIKAFRMVYPNGTIATEIIELANGVCTIKAIISDGNGVVLGTGHAQEKESSSFINKTSYIENCETSAVGRALGMCGFGIDTSVASYEEVQNAINNQNAKTPKQETRTQELEFKKMDLMKEVKEYADTNAEFKKVVNGMLKKTAKIRLGEMELEELTTLAETGRAMNGKAS